jgi:hypothetical protein
MGEHAEQIPFVLTKIAPSYCHAVAGAKILKEKFGLETNDEGFQEISKILIQRFFNEHSFPSNVIPKLDVRICRIYDSQSISVGLGAQSYNRPFFYSVVSTNLTLVGSSDVTGGPTNFICDLDRLKEPIEELKNPNILAFCFGMFLFGNNY